jgi:hypothetical protein
MRYATRAASVLATGALIGAASAVPAAAAPAGQSLTSFGARADAAGVDIRLNLTGVPGLSSLPTVPALNLDLGKPQTLELIDADGTAAHGAGAPASTANAAVLNGTLASLPVISSLNKAVTTTLASPGPRRTSDLSFDQAGIGPIDVAPLQAVTTPSTLGNASQGALTDLSLLSVKDILGATLPPSVTAALTTAGTTLQTALTTLTGAVNTAIGNLPLPAQAQVKAIEAEITTIEKTVQNLPTTLLTKTLVSLAGVSVSQSITHTATGVVATARSSVANLSLLGGLVVLNGFDNSVTAAAAGTPGSATANPQPNVATATVQNLADVSLGSTGLQADLGSLSGLGVSAPVVAALNTALTSVVSALNSVLGSVGVSIVPAAYTRAAAANGTSSSATSSGLAISVAPPGLTSGSAANDALLLVRIGAADASVEAAVSSPPVTSAVPPASAPQLAYTGADLPLTGGVALVVLAAGVAVLRRRHRA